ncbi:TscA family type II toxin-antitoxin system antitoxin [Staphylococcus pettenkoferi]|uniref:TscA family type II toxin-antitoxin system antitoxin n=1 Tax=Staphylococcus pettenkoferi TaxID=170573 RepID=UPI0011A7424A|nr:hypothetical protein [Staphylococcus pettenkoferi]
MEEQLFGKVDEKSKEVLKEMLEVFDSAINDRKSVYKLTVNEGQSTEEVKYINREEQLQGVIEWAIDMIGGNIEIDELGGNE